MDLDKSKMKNTKSLPELEPNFPVVATPQSSERIIYIISNTDLLPPGWQILITQEKTSQMQWNLSKDTCLGIRMNLKFYFSLQLSVQSLI